jgi:8-oxo-dGTP diphosphatase
MADMTTKKQVSAGGVVFRRRDPAVEVALIAVDARGEQRWQLPKGLVGAGEEPEETALREVQEETGLLAETVAPLQTIEYWYYGGSGVRRVRFHKFVHFYLTRYLEGDVADHDHEAVEARWVEIGEAAAMLSFKGERAVVAEAAEILGVQPA